MSTTDTTTSAQDTVSSGETQPAGHHGGHGYNSDKPKYLTRLKRIEGQTRGIHRMIDADEYCIDILTQISAINSALENVALALLEDHLNHCVASAAEEGGPVAEEKLAEAAKAIRRMVKS